MTSLDSTAASTVGAISARPAKVADFSSCLLYTSIGDLPSSVRLLRRSGTTTSDVVIAFINDAASLDREIESLANTITPDGSLWIAWPRKAAGHRSDITDNIVRNTVLPLGLVDVKVAALDDDWSALKMVWRKELRATRR